MRISVPDLEMQGTEFSEQNKYDRRSFMISFPDGSFAYYGAPIKNKKEERIFFPL